MKEALNHFTVHLFGIFLLLTLSKGLTQNCPPYGYYNTSQFGQACEYRCRCVHEEQCDRETGSCANGCAPGWMGSGCQYRNLSPLHNGTFQSFDSGSPSESASRAEDGDPTTCSKSYRDSAQGLWWRVDFPRRYYIVGLILKVPAASTKPYRVQLSDDWTFSNSTLCYQHRDSLVPTELEIMCKDAIAVKHIRVTVAETFQTMELCEVQIYGGRYVSYKGSVTMSSHFTSWQFAVASAAVDGRPMLDGDDQESVAQRTCAVTDRLQNQHWQFEYANVMNIMGVYVFGRIVPDTPEYNAQIEGFVVERLLTDGSQERIFTDSPSSTNYEYYQPRRVELETPMSSIGIQIIHPDVNHLSLCEVEVFAECPDGKCGWDCSDVCYCSTITTGTFRKEGTCPYGCRPRWTGENGRCDKTCTDNTTWSLNCAKKCFCADGAPCNIDTGECPGVCAAGWEGLECNRRCTDTRYGHGCNETCGACYDHVPCDAATGLCPGECAAGWQGLHCKTPCEDFAYGQGCSKSCGMCLGSKPCEKVGGQCDDCDPGFTGQLCNVPCTDRRYGLACGQTCGRCRQNASCDVVSGKCPNGCEPGLQGSLCKLACDDYFYDDCTVRCGHCKGSAPCDKVTGHCVSCAAGFEGDLCKSECPPYTYGPNCRGRCRVCTGNRPCNTTTGECPGGVEPGNTEEHQTESPSGTNNESSSATPLVYGLVGVIICLVVAVVFVGICMIRYRRTALKYEATLKVYAKPTVTANTEEMSFYETLS